MVNWGDHLKAHKMVVVRKGLSAFLPHRSGHAGLPDPAWEFRPKEFIWVEVNSFELRNPAICKRAKPLPAFWSAPLAPAL